MKYFLTGEIFCSNTEGQSFWDCRWIVARTFGIQLLLLMARALWCIGWWRCWAWYMVYWEPIGSPIDVAQPPLHHHTVNGNWMAWQLGYTKVVGPTAYLSKTWFRCSLSNGDRNSNVKFFRRHLWGMPQLARKKSYLEEKNKHRGLI